MSQLGIALTWAADAAFFVGNQFDRLANHLLDRTVGQ